jgi:hypothetical protein
MFARAIGGGPPAQRWGYGPGLRPGFGSPRGGGAPGMQPQAREAGDYHYVDVHGAGSQRSDPKAGDPGMFPHGRGPQGDVIRIYNYVRLARSGPET